MLVSEPMFLSTRAIEIRNFNNPRNILIPFTCSPVSFLICYHLGLIQCLGIIPSSDVVQENLTLKLGGKATAFVEIKIKHRLALFRMPSFGNNFIPLSGPSDI